MPHTILRLVLLLKDLGSKASIDSIHPSRCFEFDWQITALAISRVMAALPSQSELSVSLAAKSSTMFLLNLSMCLSAEQVVCITQAFFSPSDAMRSGRVNQNAKAASFASK